MAITRNEGLIPEREPKKRLPLPGRAAGAQSVHCQHWSGETSTSHSNPAHPVWWVGLRNGCYPNAPMSINWRASLVLAAAVFPAPRAYTNVAAVEKLVVNP